MTGPDDPDVPPPESSLVPPPHPHPFGAAPGPAASESAPADTEPTEILDRPIWERAREPEPTGWSGLRRGPTRSAPATSAPSTGAAPPDQDYGYYGGWGRHVPPPGPAPPPPTPGPNPPTGPPWTGAPAPAAPARPGGRDRPPGWVWPVVAVLALLTGLLGGAVGGALVAGEDSPPAPVEEPIAAPGGAPAPLPAGNDSIASVAAKVLPSTVQVLSRGGADAVGGGTGSGFVIDRRGHVITNNHVVANGTDEGDIVVVDQAGRRHPASIVGRSPVYDIAVLDVERGRALTPAAIGSSSSLHIGDTVVAIGSPLGLSSTVTAGIVSAVERPVTTGDTTGSSYINAVQTDAAINPGNSGGPLVNLRGQVVGVNSAIATMGGLGSEAGSIGVGFAIPMEQVRVTANQILADGKAVYPVIGANVDTGRTASGAEVMDVPPGTPAADGGLRQGDVVVAVNGKRVTDGIGLIVAIRSHRPGETITLTVRRDGTRAKVLVRLDAKVG